MRNISILFVLMSIFTFSCSEEINIKQKIEDETGILIPSYEKVELKSSSAPGDYGEKFSIQFNDTTDLSRVISQINNSAYFVDTLIMYEYSTKEYFQRQQVNKVWIRTNYGYRFEEYFDEGFQFKVYRLDTLKKAIHYTYFEE